MVARLSSTKNAALSGALRDKFLNKHSFFVERLLFLLYKLYVLLAKLPLQDHTHPGLIVVYINTDKYDLQPIKAALPTLSPLYKLRNP